MPARFRNLFPLALDKVGPLVTVAATLVGVIGAFGFPPVALQYYRLNLPLQLITKEQALRAGVLPSAALFLMIFAGYLAWDHLDYLKEKIRSNVPEDQDILTGMKYVARFAF